MASCRFWSTETPGRGFRCERSGSIVRVIGPSPAAHDNYVLFSRLDEGSADAAIRQEIDAFGSLGHSFEWKCHVATSILRLHRGTQFASIWGAATLAAWRRRGIYTALVDRHTATARTAGALFRLADANAQSRPMLERVGFQALVGVQGFVWQCAG
jgi:GNAT superfamily N-acetyltransferase